MNQELIAKCKNGDYDRVRQLLDEDEDIEMTDYCGYNSLMWAAKNGHTRVVELLVERGADVGAVSDFRYNALIMASISGDLDVVTLFLDMGLDVEQYNDFGNTALIEAASKGHIKIVKLLLDSGANTWPENARGQSARSRAADNNHKEVVTLIEQYIDERILREEDENSAEGNTPFDFDARLVAFFPQCFSETPRQHINGPNHASRTPSPRRNKQKEMWHVDQRSKFARQA